MRQLRLFIISLFLFVSFFMPSASFAIEAPIDESGINATSPENIVGTLGIEDAKIISPKGNVFNISFTISNREILQAGIKYGMELVPVGAKYKADERVYDEALTVYENSSIARDIVYNAPEILSGDYEMYVTLSNEGSFPFGMFPLGKVNLKATTKGINISADTCFLQVEGETTGKHYTLMQNVDINEGEFLRLTCMAVNNTDKKALATPAYEARYFSVTSGSPNNLQ